MSELPLPSWGGKIAEAPQRRKRKGVREVSPRLFSRGSVLVPDSESYDQNSEVLFRNDGMPKADSGGERAALGDIHEMLSRTINPNILVTRGFHEGSGKDLHELLFYDLGRYYNFSVGGSKISGAELKDLTSKFWEA